MKAFFIALLFPMMAFAHDGGFHGGRQGGGHDGVFRGDHDRHFEGHNDGHFGVPFGVIVPFYGPHIYVPPPVFVNPPSYPLQFWYYCPMYRDYYPNIQDCPQGWVQIPVR